MADTTYNGWKNYETWVVKLWIDNEQGDCEYWQEQAREVWKRTDSQPDLSPADAHTRRKEDAAMELSQQLKDFHEENTPTVTGVFADLLNAALSEVYWYEIATAMIEDEEFEIEPA